MARVLFEASAIFCSSPRYPKISSMLIDIASVELTDGRVVVVGNLLSTTSNRLFSMPRVVATR